LKRNARERTLEDVRNYREYLRAVQDALNLAPDTAKLRLSALESKGRGLPEITQNIIPNALKTNEARAEIFATRKELLDILSAN